MITDPSVLISIWEYRALALDTGGSGDGLGQTSVWLGSQALGVARKIVTLFLWWTGPEWLATQGVEKFFIRSMGKFHEEIICSWNWPIFKLLAIPSYLSSWILLNPLNLFLIILYWKELRMAGNSSWPKLCRAGVKDRGKLSNSNIQAIADPSMLERRHWPRIGESERTK